MLFSTIIETPLGQMRSLATEQGICVFDFAQRRMMNSIVKRVEKGVGTEAVDGHVSHFDELKRQIDEYYNGSRTEFDIPLHLIGTPFQLSVWDALTKIPFGTTRSYLKQSIFLGNEKAIRAVARANGENGIAIIVPCHRVIGENGNLTGYGGGLWRKKWLLDHEVKVSGKSMQMSLYE
jgi:AraC family transcriptional regulator of adaptative response/methylated-DNA-[protein]-cysteine methyltransferase